ncbi:MAG: glycosyltransferase N-terminal domain-containing protein [Chitinophagaceae bacterium]
MAFTYDIFCKLYPAGVKVAALFNPKARLWVQGRKHIFQKLEATVGQNTQPLLWMHCASLGEFEMGRPVLEAFRKQYPNYKILLTFFSPSGYEIRKNYNGTDYVFYLPNDSRENAERFMKIVKPSLAIFVKYEFWHYYLQTLKTNNIKLLLISAVFRQDQLFFKKHGEFFKNDLKCFTHFFVQNQASLDLLDSIGITNATLSGDTRFDRVVEIAHTWQPIPLIEQFSQDKQVFVAGSTWQEDENSFAPFVNTHPEIKTIIAPHDISEERINDCLKKFPTAIRFSQYSNAPETADNIKANTLIIDNIGMLNKLYRYATVTYVGGAWGTKGIHNILEAAVFGKPVLYGPNYSKNYEAQELVDAGGAFSYSEPEKISEHLAHLFSDKTALEKASAAARDFVQKNMGATEVIMNKVNGMWLEA